MCSKKALTRPVIYSINTYQLKYIFYLPKLLKKTKAKVTQKNWA